MIPECNITFPGAVAVVMMINQTGRPVSKAVASHARLDWSQTEYVSDDARERACK